MKLQEIVQQLDFEIKSGGAGLDSEVRRGYVSDLMSDVIANAKKGDLWITLQVHINIIAIASMKELSGIVLIMGRQPESATLEKATSMNIPILVSELPAFEVAGRLYQLGITGNE
jgi:predicted transcriptional regulator